MQQTGSCNEGSGAGARSRSSSIRPAPMRLRCRAGRVDGGSGSRSNAPRREPANCRRAAEAELRAEFEQRLAEETRRSFEAGRERGRQEGRQAEREAQAAAQKAAEEQRMRQAAELIESFAQERDRYLHAVEHEVVKLALAVAARILRREAQMDPLLLTGAVRVALGQLSGSTEVRLRVPAGRAGLVDGSDRPAAQPGREAHRDCREKECGWATA